MSVNFVKGSTNYIRALLQFENGVQATGAVVSATISKTHGDNLPGLVGVPMLEVDGNVTYNYQGTVTPDLLNVDEGVLYQVEVTATLGGNTIKKRQSLSVTE